MAEPSSLDNRTLYRRTLVTAGAMLGACVVFVGTLTLVASSLVGRAVVPDIEAQADAGVVASVGSVHSVRTIVPSPNASSTIGKGQK
jgi:hypothetical protein